MEQRSGLIPEKAYILFLYLGLVVLSISLTSLLARPIQYIIDPETLSPAVRVGGIALGEVTKEQARQRITALLNAAQEKPLHLTYMDRTWTVTPEQLGLAYDTDATYHELIEKSRRSQGIWKWWQEWLGRPVDPAVELHFSWKREAAMQTLEQIKREIDQPPANASLEIVGDQVRFTPHKTGRTLSIEETVKRMELSLAALQPERNVPLAVEETEPDVISAKLDKIDTLLAEASTELPKDFATVRQNVQEAAKRLNGRLIESKAAFSFQKEIGPFLQGGPFVTQADSLPLHKTGGIQFGIGQTASTFYWAALKANLTILERHAHLQPQPYITPGLDAAIWDGKLDLKVENPFSHPVYVDAKVAGNRLQIRLFGNKQDRQDGEIVVEKLETFKPETVFLIDGSLSTSERRVAQTGVEGVLAEIYRIVKSSNAPGQESRHLLSKDFFRPIPKVVYIGPPAQIINQDGRDTALYAPVNDTSTDTPDSSTDGSFANDPNMAQPSDIPPDIAGDPNVAKTSP
jgi:vancomycin resistance protein YoaR